MASAFLVTLLALIATASAEPLIVESYAPGYASAAIVAPGGPLVAAGPVVAAGPIGPAFPAYPGVPAFQAIQTYPPLPYAQVSSYAYGSQVNDYLYKPAALTAAYTTVPYAYASDWYYRQ